MPEALGRLFCGRSTDPRRLSATPVHFKTKSRPLLARNGQDGAARNFRVEGARVRRHLRRLLEDSGFRENSTAGKEFGPGNEPVPATIEVHGSKPFRLSRVIVAMTMACPGSRKPLPIAWRPFRLRCGRVPRHGVPAERANPEERFCHK
jgi:hypothetical protein